MLQAAAHTVDYTCRTSSTCSEQCLVASTHRVAVSTCFTPLETQSDSLHVSVSFTHSAHSHVVSTPMLTHYRTVPQRSWNVRQCALSSLSHQVCPYCLNQGPNSRACVPFPAGPAPLQEWCDPNKQHKKKRAQPLTRTIFFNQAPQMQSMQQYVAHPMLAQQQLPQQPLMTTMLPGTIPMMGHDLGHMQGAYVNQRVF